MRKRLPNVKAYAACWHEHSAILQEIAENRLDEQTRKREISPQSSERMKLKKQICRQVRTSSWNVITNRMVNRRKIAEL